MYSKMSIYYDQIFPLKEDTLGLLKTYLPIGKTHDLACGTGSYAIALHDQKYTVSGSDLDEVMIQTAIQKRHGKDPIFEVQDMRDFREDESFNGIYIIGNSLVHVPTLQDVEKVCLSVIQSLKENGVFIIQIINYDRIYEHQITELPTIKTTEFTFERFYHFQEDGLQFETVLTTKEDVSRGMVTLNPIRPNQLSEILQKVGFTITNTFGSFQQESFDRLSSFHYIVIAKKIST